MNKQVERRSFEVETLEIREEEGEAKRLVGYAALFDRLSVPLFGFREKIAPGAFTESLKKKNVKALWNHNSDYPLANQKRGTLTLEEDDKGLRFEMELPETSWGKDAEISVKRGDTDGVSFAFRSKVDEWDDADEKNVIRTLREVELHEISPTPFAAYPQTKVNVRSAEEVYNDYLAMTSQEDDSAGVEAERISQEAEVRERELKLLEIEVK